MNQVVKYEVQGMTCEGCQRSVVNALKQAGVEVTPHDVSLSEGTVSVDASTPESVVRSAIEEAGYDVGQRRDS